MEGVSQKYYNPQFNLRVLHIYEWIIHNVFTMGTRNPLLKRKETLTKTTYKITPTLEYFWSFPSHQKEHV